jgi:hypothetical protein
MKTIFRVISVFIFFAASSVAETRTCTGLVSLHDFKLVAASRRGGPTLPLGAVNALGTGDILIYRPARPSVGRESKGKVALVLVPTPEETSAEISVLDARPADQATQWAIPFRVAIVALVFGPQGLDIKKVNSLVNRKESLISQLADYAQQTARVGALVDTLTAWEQSPSKQNGLDAILNGFSAQYGVAIPRLNPGNPADQQAALLLRALLPPLASYDPLTPQPSARVQQSAGLAATVASLFFGSPVALAAGGAALFQNLRTLMFPDTDFRSAFAQSNGSDEVALCSEPRAGRSRTRPAYLWALRLPACGPPALKLAEDLHLPLAWKSPVKFISSQSAQIKLLPRVREWQLVSTETGNTCPVRVAPEGASTDTLVLDLTDAALAPGTYRLAGKWDWDTFQLQGMLHVHRFGDIGAARVTSASEDRLVEGSGPVPIQIEGTDFQFVERLALLRTDRRLAAPIELPLILPSGRNAGPQDSVETEVDTKALTAGAYRLRLTLRNRQTSDLTVNIHPALPEIENLPLRVNLGENLQRVQLNGSGLERIERITAPGTEWELSPPAGGGKAATGEREATVKLGQTAVRGDRIQVLVTVQGMHAPVPIPEAIEVAGPRPRIAAVDTSLSSAAAVQLREAEIPAGYPVGFALRTESLEFPATLELACGSTESALVLHPGESREGSRVDLAGESLLFLLLDPKALGYAGCDLTAMVRSASTGLSDPVRLGHVVVTPHISTLELTDEALGGALFAAVLRGKDLQSIEKAGWDESRGYPVLSLPRPDAAFPQTQTLRIALPWPAPAPRAPIYVWLRGEKQGRATQVTF